MRPIFVAALALATAACATVPGQGPIHEYELDVLVPMPAEGAVEVSHKAGPFELVHVKFRNRPSAKDIALSRDDTRDMSHPKPIVVVRSTATHTARVSLATILEDEAGKPLMTCASRLDQELAPGYTDDWNTCQLEGIRTADWPRVKNVHVVLGFRVRGDEPEASPSGAVVQDPPRSPGPAVEGGQPARCPGLPDPNGC
jgi:hypothetical protein